MNTLRKLALGVGGTCLLVIVVCAAVVSAQSGQPVRTPRLPETPYRYVAIGPPAHFEAAHAQDNTPRANRLTDAGAALGRVLFYDTHLSANNTTACASWQKHAFADPKPFSVGFDGRQTDRHAPNLTGLRHYMRARFFWDERGGNLEDMVMLPVRSSIEMGEDVLRLPQLARLAYYPGLFRRAFGDPAVTERRIARALAQFLRSLVSYHSRYDHGIVSASSVMEPFANFTRQENHGKALFVRNCARCHLPAEDHHFFGRVPGNNGAERPTRTDGGLGDVALNAQDVGAFKSPSLRSVEVAGPYMHDGSLATLEDVIDHYSRNLTPQPPLDFTESEKRALHGVTLSLGTAVPPDRAFLQEVAAFLRVVGAPWYSEHLAFTKMPSRDLPQLLPLERTDDMVDMVLENLAVVHDERRVPIALENVAYYFEYPGSTLSEFNFLLKTLTKGRCGLLLDVENLRINSTNHGYDARRALRRLPAGIVRAAHVAGGTTMDGVHVDSHDRPISDDTLALLKDVLQLQRPECVVVERDQDVDDVEEVLDDVRRVREVVAQVWPS